MPTSCRFLPRVPIWDFRSSHASLVVYARTPDRRRKRRKFLTFEANFLPHVVPFSTDLYSGRHTVHRTASYPRTMTVSDGSGLAARRRSTVPGDAKPEPEKRTLLHTADPAAYLGKPSVHSLYQRLKISVLAVYRKVVPGVRKGRRRGDESGYARTCDSDCIRGFPGIMHSRPGAARRPGLRPALGCVAERPFA